MRILNRCLPRVIAFTSLLISPMILCGANHGALTANELEHLGNGTVEFDLAAIRLNPSMLENKTVMQYFIGLNNCHDADVQRAVENELDFPALAGYYRNNAAAILSALPDTAGIRMYIGNTKGALIWGKAVGGYDPSLKTLSLGQYDAQRKAFPVVVSDHSASFELAGIQHIHNNRQSLEQTCPAAYAAMMRSPTWIKDLPTGYNVTIGAKSFTEVSATEAEARRYIDSVQARFQRAIYLTVDIHIRAQTPTTTTNELNFTGDIARVFAISKGSEQLVGTIFNDATLANPDIKAPPKAFTTMKIPDDVRLERYTVVYVWIVSGSCGWPLEAQKKENLQRFMTNINAYGHFYDKYNLNMQVGQIRGEIDSHPGFCRVPSERDKWEHMTTTLWPTGPMAAPAK